MMIKSIVTMKTLFALATWTFIQKVSFYALLAVLLLEVFILFYSICIYSSMLFLIYSFLGLK